MERTFVQTDFKLSAFKVNRVIFDDSDMVSMDIKCKINEQWMQTSLLFTFRKFNDLLRFSGSTGDKLQLLVSDKLLLSGEKPYVIFLNEETLVFSACNLELYYLIAEDVSCFSVEEVTPIPYLQQVKNLRKNIADFAEIHLENKPQVNTAINEMAAMYRYYNGLIELNLNESAARQMAGLSNEHLFKLSYYAACRK